MAKKVGKLANRYAKALLIAVIKELGTSGSPSPAQKAATNLSSFAKIWDEDRQFSTSIQNPMFEKGERMNALVEVAKKAGLEDILVRFLRVAFQRDRISLLPEIAAAFSEQADSSAGLLQVEVTTARDVPDSEKSAIEKSLVEQLKGSLQFSWKQDPSILGGLVVRYGGKVLDGSLSGRLARLEGKLRASV